MGTVEHLIEKQRRERRLARLFARFEPLAPASVAAEWRPAPLGRLGRILWTDIERYLEFVEIARSPTPDPSPQEASCGLPVSMTYSMLD